MAVSIGPFLRGHSLCCPVQSAIYILFVEIVLSTMETLIQEPVTILPEIFPFAKIRPLKADFFAEVQHFNKKPKVLTGGIASCTFPGKTRIFRSKFSLIHSRTGSSSQMYQDKEGSSLDLSLPKITSTIEASKNSILSETHIEDFPP